MDVKIIDLEEKHLETVTQKPKQINMKNFPIISFRELQNTDIYEPDMRKYIRDVIEIKGGQIALNTLDQINSEMAALEEHDDHGWRVLNQQYMNFLKRFFPDYK